MKTYGIRINYTDYFFDMVSNISFSLNSSATSFPLVDRTTITDHVIEENATVTINGVFSIVGDFNKIPQVINHELVYVKKEHKQTVQDFFELINNIKKQAIKIDLLTPNGIFKNFVIVSFSWNDNVSSGDYQIGLQQIQTFSSVEVKKITIAPDPNLPDLNDPISQSVVQKTMLDNTAEVDKYILDALSNQSLVEQSFIDGAKAGVIAGTIIGVAAGGGLIAGITIMLVTAGVISASVPVVGLIVGALLAVAAAVVAAFWALVSVFRRIHLRRKYKYIFQGYRDAKRMGQEIDRYKETVQAIYKEIRALDQVMTGYSVPTNQKQNILMEIESQYFNFNFDRKKVNGSWVITIKDANEKVILSNELYSVKLNSIFSIKDDIKDALFSVGDFNVYLIYDYMKHKNGVYKKEEMDLTYITIVISSAKMKELHTTVGKLAIESMKR